MLPKNICIICVGTLKESYLRDAVGEYKKRLSGTHSVDIVELKEVRLPDKPSQTQIAKALDEEAEMIRACIPSRAFIVPLCVEGRPVTSEQLTGVLRDASRDYSCLCFIIGSSCGLSPTVKNLGHFKLSLSSLTFTHQLARVVLLEAIYRCDQIDKGTGYNK